MNTGRALTAMGGLVIGGLTMTSDADAQSQSQVLAAHDQVGNCVQVTEHDPGLAFLRPETEFYGDEEGIAQGWEAIRRAQEFSSSLVAPASREMRDGLEARDGSDIVKMCPEGQEPSRGHRLDVQMNWLRPMEPQEGGGAFGIDAPGERCLAGNTAPVIPYFEAVVVAPSNVQDEFRIWTDGTEQCKNGVIQVQVDRFQSRLEELLPRTALDVLGDRIINFQALELRLKLEAEEAAAEAKDTQGVVEEEVRKAQEAFDAVDRAIEGTPMEANKE